MNGIFFQARNQSGPSRPPATLTTAVALLTGLLLIPMGCDFLGLGGEDDESDDPTPSKFVEVFQEHPSSSALYVTHADTTVAAYNPDLKLPLASTVKYVVAIEYAQQAAAGDIRPDSLVALEQVNRFFIDFGTSANESHRDWIERARSTGRLDDGHVPLREVARGMMDFSSNPATEYLMDLLTLKEINETLDEIGLDRHDPLYYIISATYIGDDKNFGEDERAQFVENLSPDERASRAADIHQMLAQDADSSYRSGLELPSLVVQQAWSNHLPGSTAREYVQLMQEINDRTHLNEDAQEYLYEVINGIVRSDPGNREIFSHAGRKGGSTAWVFTEAAFFTMRDDGTQTEYAVLLDGSREAQDNLSDDFNEFRRGVLGEPAFRETLAQQFGTANKKEN